MARTAPERESASIVLVGSFNPAILHPQWLAKQGLIPESEAEHAKVELVSPHLTAVHFEWFDMQVMDNRFMVTTADPSQFPSLQECVSGIFALLEFTPIEAMGLNSDRHVRVSTTHWTRLEQRLAPHNLWAGVLPGPRDGASSLQTLTVVGIRPGSKAERLSVTIEPSHHFDGGIFVRTNEHFRFSEGGDATAPMRTLRDNWVNAIAYSNDVTDQLVRMASDE